MDERTRPNADTVEPEGWLVARRVESFQQAWKAALEAAQPPPVIADYLAELSLADRRLALIELIKIDLHGRAQSGQPRALEAYLDEFPELREPQVPVELVVEEVHALRESGSAALLATTVTRFPEHADALAESASLFDTPTAAAEKPNEIVPHLLDVGMTLDDFELRLKLGAGGFGSVFLAFQKSMSRYVALKVTTAPSSEPQTLAQLDHEHIVRVYDERVLPDGRTRLLYMQFVRGGTLEAVVSRVKQTPEAERSGRLILQAVDAALEKAGESPPSGSTIRSFLKQADWPTAVAWMGARLAEALHYAHKRDVLHRDVKPANVLLTAEASPKLADFNISFAGQLQGANPREHFGGSIAYMSPEQLEACDPAHRRRPEDLDERTDVYSLAVLLWELLYGTRPFSEDALFGSWTSKIRELAARRRAGIPVARIPAPQSPVEARLQRLLLACLAPNRDDRPASAQILQRHFDLCAQPEAIRLLGTETADWRTRARLQPTTAVLWAALLPNILAAIFNLVYNQVAIIDPLHAVAPKVKDAFLAIQLTINVIAFPIGIRLIYLLAKRVADQGWRAPPTREHLAPAVHQQLRRDCLLLGHRASMISLVLWLLAGLAYPLALHLSLGAVPQEMLGKLYIHFWVSLALCGLIAASYPFLLVSLIALRAFLPALIERVPVDRQDQPLLRRFRNLVRFYTPLASGVPLLSVAFLILTDSPVRFALMTLSVGGLLGLGLAWWLSNALQDDVAVLDEVLFK